MKAGFLIVILLFGYFAWKYYESKPVVSGKSTVPTKSGRHSAYQDRPGVSFYCNMAGSQSKQQLRAYQKRNNCQTTQSGFAPAFGYQENQPYSVCRITV